MTLSNDQRHHLSQCFRATINSPVSDRLEELLHTGSFSAIKKLTAKFNGMLPLRPGTFTPMPDSDFTPEALYTRYADRTAADGTVILLNDLGIKLANFHDAANAFFYRDSGALILSTTEQAASIRAETGGRFHLKW